MTLRWGLAGALVLAAAGAAPGQEAPTKRPGRFKFGPLFVTPRLQLKNAGVDSNVFNSLTREVPDTSAVLSPSADGVLPLGRRIKLMGSGYLDFNYFRRQRDEQSTDFGGRGSGELKLGAFKFFAGGGGSQARQRFSIDLNDRLLRQEKYADGGVTYSLTHRISLTGSVSSRIYRFENKIVAGQSVKDSFDRRSQSGSAQMRYGLTKQTTFLAVADVIEDRFLARNADAALQNVRSYRYLGGFEFGERALINGSVLAGVREFPRSGGAPPYRGPALAVAATVPLFQVGRLSGTVDREVYYATFRAGDLRNTYVSTRFRAEPSFDLPFNFLGRGILGFEETRYLLPYTYQGTLVRRADHFWIAGGSLLRRVGETLRVGGTLTWNRRVSNFAELSYQGLRYGVQAEVVP